MMRLVAFLAAVGVVLYGPSAYGAEARVAAPKMMFLETDAARRAIIDDSQGPYFSRMESREMAAKTGAAITGGSLDQQREECRRRYWASVRSLTADERDTLRMLVGKLYPALAHDYPRLGRLPWSFLKVSDRIEGGLPHTRGQHIVLSERVCREMAVVRRVGRGTAGLNPMLQLLLHEQVHVLQRQEPALFDSLYEQVWGLEKAASIRSCPWLENLQLLNPDAIDCPWVIPLEAPPGGAPRTIWPLVVLREGEGVRHMPRDMQMLAIDLEKTPQGYEVRVAADGRPVSRPLESVTELQARWPLTRTWYHPHEAAADSLAALFVADRLAGPAGNEGRRPEPPPAVDSLRRWLRENLAAEPATVP